MSEIRAKRYHEYLKSGAWDVHRWDRLVADDFRCQVCRGEATEVHHRTYEHKYQELREDLLSLCRGCHEGVSEIAKAIGPDRAVEAYAKRRERARQVRAVVIDTAIGRHIAWVNDQFERIQRTLLANPNLPTDQQEDLAREVRDLAKLKARLYDRLLHGVRVPLEVTP